MASAPPLQRVGAVCWENFAFANRHAIAYAVRESIASVLGREIATGTCQVYNVAKLARRGARLVPLGVVKG